jgi:hypothetical protein
MAQTPSEYLRALADEIDADEALSSAEREAIASGASAVVTHLERVRRFRELAHVHDVPHPFAESPRPSAFYCCDCGNGLISDKGTERLLICPRLHGQRPPELRPKNPEGAVECGMES